MNSSCEGFRKSGNFLSSPLHFVNIDWAWESLFFSLGRGDVFTVPSKENTGYFQKRHSLLGGLSPGVTFLWESFPNWRVATWDWDKKQQYFLIHCACVCLKLHFCACHRPDSRSFIKQDLFLKHNKKSWSGWSGQVWWFQHKPGPSLTGLIPICFLPQVTRWWPTSSPPSQQKEKGRGRRWHQPTTEKQNLSPQSPANFYYLLSLEKLGHLVAGYITSKVGGEEWLLGRLLEESTAVHP